MGTKRLDSLDHYMRYGLACHIQCKCGRVVIVPARRLADYCVSMRHSTDIRAVQTRMKCLQCKRRGHVRISAIELSADRKR